MDKSFAEKIGLIMGLKSAATQSDLADKIVAVIRRKERINALAKAVSFGFLAVLALISVIVVWQTQSSVIINSEAMKLLSLAFSDTAIVLSLWKEYSLSLLGSIPFVSIVFLLACFWTLFASARVTIKNSKILLNHVLRHA